MVSLASILWIIKRIVAVGVLICIILTPTYLAVVNGREKYDAMRVRFGSWIFGWSIIGWLFALFISAKK
ncbi:MAG: hypothetical protein IKP35_00690 [Alphaproteobacteria bacterium]|nr:hypothetical protein [Alphaproteobacteria bacterium]